MMTDSPKLPKWGLHPNASEREYRLWPAANVSALKNFDYSAAHVYAALTDPPRETDAQAVGTATHFAILEPDRFNDIYVRGAAGDLTRKGPKDENNQIKADNPDKRLIRYNDWPKIMRMRDAVLRHPQMRAILQSDGFTELAYLWQDSGTGLACKARADRLGGTADGWPVILDVKKYGNRGGVLTQHAIEKQISTFGYHCQAAHYVDGLDAIHPAPRRFMLGFVEENPPHGVRLVELDNAAMELGRRKVQRWLSQLKRCQDSGEWPGWPDAIETMGVPEYEYRDEEREMALEEGEVW